MSLFLSLRPFAEGMASPLTTGRAVCIKKKIHFSKDGVVDMIKENWIFQLRQQPVSNIDG